MKKLMVLTGCLSIVGVAYADVTSFLNSRVPQNFSDQAKNFDVDCVVRNPFDGRCTVFNSHYDDFSMTRDPFPSYDPGTVKETVNLRVTCSVDQYKCLGLTNPDSTCSGAQRTDHKTFGPSIYDVAFTWYTLTNPIDGKTSFYIYNNDVSSSYIGGSQDDAGRDNKHCVSNVIDAIKNLNGQSF